MDLQLITDKLATAEQLEEEAEEIRDCLTASLMPLVEMYANERIIPPGHNPSRHWGCCTAGGLTATGVADKGVYFTVSCTYCGTDSFFLPAEVIIVPDEWLAAVNAEKRRVADEKAAASEAAERQTLADLQAKYN